MTPSPIIGVRAEAYRAASRAVVSVIAPVILVHRADPVLHPQRAELGVGLGLRVRASRRERDDGEEEAEPGARANARRRRHRARRAERPPSSHRSARRSARREKNPGALSPGPRAEDGGAPGGGRERPTGAAAARKPSARARTRARPGRDGRSTPRALDGAARRRRRAARGACVIATARHRSEHPRQPQTGRHTRRPRACAISRRERHQRCRTAIIVASVGRDASFRESITRPLVFDSGPR